jgi:hypothetical protein
VLWDFVGVGDQRYPFQELRQHTGVWHVFVVGCADCFVERGRVLQVGGEFVCDADEFVEVVQPGQVLRVGRRFQLGAVSGALQHRFDQLPEWRVEPAAKIVEHLDETRDRLGRSGVEHRHLAFGGGLERVGETGTGVLGVDRHASLGPIADAAARRVEDAPHADRVTRVVQHPKIRDQVANLLALVKPNAPNDFVRNAGADEHFFQ